MEYRAAAKGEAKNDTLKFIAIITMLIDHIGYVFFPNLIFLRIIGRISFPIFAYNMTIGYINTGNLKKYMMRLLGFGVIAQIPYIYFAPGKINVMFTLLFGLYAIYFIDKKKYFFVPAPLLIALLVPVEYGIYGVSVIILFYVFRDNKLFMRLSFVAATAIYVFYYRSSVQAFCVLSLIFILKKWKLNISISKYFFYIFYPLHIIIILLIKNYL
ncbi:TraX protein [Oxobacter pfennigii]|uniref:TraX protein n=1 Tax=Oxobacter pfennigii TaxID=36849 RepID=A0A0N8NSL6_9CLOT|nr:TraX protein [Oxobacter pfennigii]